MLLVAAACGRPHHEATSVATSEPTPPTPVASAGAVATAAPPSPVVSFATAESTYKNQDYKTSADQFEGYTTTHPDNAWGFYMLGLSAWKAGDLPRAQQAFEAALVRDPRHVKTLVNLGRVLLASDQPDSALARASDAVALDSGSADAWRVLGRAAGQLGRIDSALDAFRTAIAIDPRDRWAMNDMGLVLIDAGRYNEAIGPLAMAVGIDSTSPVFENNLGLALERTGHPTSAATAYQRALDVDSTYTKAQVSLDRVKDATDTEPVDLAAFRDAFTHEIEEWRSTRTVTAAVAPQPQ
jgi:predicted Zn-dependent protease